MIMDLTIIGFVTETESTQFTDVKSVLVHFLLTQTVMNVHDKQFYLHKLYNNFLGFGIHKHKKQNTTQFYKI